MARDWKKFDNDEIFAMWKGYLRTEFANYDDPLRFSNIEHKAIRLTPFEIIKLVDELMDRLEISMSVKNDPT